MPATRLDAAGFRAAVEQSAHAELTRAASGRAAVYAELLADITTALAEGAGLAEVPRLIGTRMAPFGWLWNGFYVLRPDGELHVGPAHGPPVCAVLERQGGMHTSGMCFDALLLNQTLVAYDVKAWPGYVSCDAASGLATVSGIVCPVRGAAGEPVAVWDLDATQVVTAEDVRFCDVLFGTLSLAVDAGWEFGGV